MISMEGLEALGKASIGAKAASREFVDRSQLASFEPIRLNPTPGYQLIERLYRLTAPYRGQSDCHPERRVEGLRASYRILLGRVGPFIRREGR